MAPPEKRCCKCQLMRPLSDFNRSTSAADGLQARCRLCAAAWYQANKARHKLNVRARNNRVRAEHRERITNYLLEHPCEDCGEADVRVLEFDHNDPHEKVGEVVRLASSCIPWRRVQAEISKCTVRCANCHRIRTNDMFGFWRSAVEVQRREEQHGLATGRLEVILRR